LTSLRLCALVAALMVAGAAVAAGYAFLAPKQYDATAHLIVSPVSPTDPTYFGLGLLRDTSGKRTAAASAAVLVRSPQVADVVRTQLGLTQSRDSLLSKVRARVVGASDVVAVTVRDSSAVRSAQLANAFAGALVSQRTASFQSQLATAIRRTQEQLLALPPNRRTIGSGAALEQRLTTLQSLQGQPDPTLRPADQAEAPTSAAWPRPVPVIGAGVGAGLLLGLLVLLGIVLVRRGRRAAPVAAAAPAGTVAAPVPVPVPVPDRAREAELEQHSEELKERAEELERLTAELQARSEALAQEAEQREAEKLEAEQRDAERREAEKLEAEKREAEQREAQKREADKEQREAAAREADEEQRAAEAREAEQREAERRVAEARETERREAEARETERREAEAREAERREAEARETERREAEAREAERREAEEREAAFQRLPAPEPVLASAGLPGVALYRADAPVNGSGRGHWNLVELQKLVDERGREFPDRMDEWISYLFFLREYAEVDGTVPASFDWLIEDEFAEIV
jgi:capsular polysaccharide biosynthesis protein